MSELDLTKGISAQELPEHPGRSEKVPHAPKRHAPLNLDQKKQSITNALRYFDSKHHEVLAGEFAEELENFGHIYMYRFCPPELIENPEQMKARPIQQYPGKSLQCKAIMLMIMNNLDPKVAQFPHELVTYGGNGQVFSNWAQFRLVMHYLSVMDENQTLVMYSGHPLGLFPSHPHAPRVVITNGMVIPNYSSKLDYDRMFALGVSQYGQMTAGSYCYIGPQGIVHGTTITVLNAGRKHLGGQGLEGKVFVTAGLGGMSGAQAKAAVIAGCIGVVAEICPIALKKRYEQGWLMEWTDSTEDCIKRVKQARIEKRAVSIGYLGNIVELWEKLAGDYQITKDLIVDLGSDQTSCHNPYNGGYYPVGLTKEEADKQMAESPDLFKSSVQNSLMRHMTAIRSLVNAGMFFFDYGNAFLLECHRAGAHVLDEADISGTKFIFPSYVQDIMGDVFSMGFGPFRWVCASGDPLDLEKTDEIACDVLERLVESDTSKNAKIQYSDNIQWIKEAGKHQLVVGSQARILYADQFGRTEIAAAFNRAIKNGELKGPIILSRDHHDVSGTDSPFRETSNIYDGSAFTADMAVQNCIGDSFRGATWVSLHNGGGVGWGEVINGGFGLLLDGTQEAGRRAEMMLSWDVSNGVARRCWSGNSLAREAIEKTMAACPQLHVTLPNPVMDETLLDKLIT